MLAATVVAFAVCAGAAQAAAATTLRVGTPAGDSFSFAPLAIGKDLGIFAKHNVDIDVTTFAGSAALEQALEKGTVEIALGSGTEFAFIPNGAPDTAVAALAVRPSLLVVTVRPDTGIKAVKDLKDRSIGVKEDDPVPAWLVRTLSESKGWGPQGIKALPLQAPLAADGTIDAKVAGIVADLPTALDLADRGAGRTVVDFGDVVNNFPFYVAFARNDLVERRSDDVKNFLAAWFETVKWMSDHRKPAIAKAAAVIKQSPEVTAKLYDALMPAYSPTGKFDQGALKTLAKALVTMKVLDRERDLGRYVTENLLASGTSCQNK